MPKKSIGIYIHIPFCKQKCYYCDFVSFAKSEMWEEEYIEALYQMLRNYSVKQLQGLYFAMQKELGAQAGMEIYRQLKPQIKMIYKKMPK